MYELAKRRVVEEVLGFRIFDVVELRVTGIVAESPGAASLLFPQVSLFDMEMYERLAAELFRLRAS